MVIAGRIENGVVVFPTGTTLPEGAEVLVSICARPSTNDVMPEARRQRYLAALSRIDAIPNENPSDRFSGADHDWILYGEPG